jgi:formylglycine-generating enzyme required for sulfatase activity
MPDEVVPRFVRVPPGEFTMGGDDGGEDERPAHRVFLDGYYISVYAITNEQYAVFATETGHPVPAVRELPHLVTPAQEATFRELAAPYAWRGGVPPRDREQHPVSLVAFNDAMAYCFWLSQRLGEPVRLPTEAEWERAARGGIESRRYPWGDDIDPSRANFLPEPALKKHRGTRPVGCYPPNGFELFDVSGNVWEWVSDWYSPVAYRDTERRNPRGAPAGALRIVRGGSWVTHDVLQLRCAHRHKVPADTYAYSIGFRVVYSEGVGV